MAPDGGLTRSIFSYVRRRYRNLVSDRGFEEILSGTAWALGAKVAATLVSAVTTIIIARVYGAAAVGILAVITSVMGFAKILTVLGTDTSILRLIPEHIAKHSARSAFHVYRKTQWFVIALSLATGAGLFASSNFIAESVFSKPHLSPLFQLASVFVVFRSLMILNTSAVRGLRLIRTFAMMQALSPFAMLVVLLVLTFTTRHPDAPVHAQLAAYAVTGVVGWAIVRLGFRREVEHSQPVERMPLGSILSISTPMVMTTSMQFFIGQTGVVMLGMFRTEEEVGYYSIATRLATLTVFIIRAINAMAASKFSELYHMHAQNELLRVARKSSKLIFWTTAPVLAVLLIFGQPVLRLLYGDEFTAAYAAMAILVIGKFVSAISGSTGMFMNMTGNEKEFRNIVLVATVLIIALGFALIPGFGIEGAAVAATVSLAFWNLGTLWFIKKKFGRSIGYLPGLR